MTDASLRPIDAPLYDPRFEHDACGVGFVADLTGATSRGAAPRGATSRGMVALALEGLGALEHRGAVGADALTGDGAGISLPLTPAFLRRAIAEAGVHRLRARSAALGMVFLPPEPEGAAAAHALLAETLAVEGLTLAGWRDVPVRAELLDQRTSDVAPAIRQAIVARPARISALAFARRLFMARRHAETLAARTPGLGEMAIVSLSATSVVYKGLFVGAELGDFYLDLARSELAGARYAVFHQRYATNTFPSWRLAQPFRYLAHNGEINTVRSNREAMRGRRHALGGSSWARRLCELDELLSAGGSDSLSLDEAVELRVLGGRRIDGAMLDLVPPATGLSRGAGGAAVSEPWDGPAAIVFSDGPLIGAMLDRNGLRPAAYTLTVDGLLVCASESGGIELPAGRIARHGRLGPGEVLLADVATGRLLEDAEAKAPAGARAPSVHAEAGAPIRLPRPRRQVPGDADRLRLALGLDGETLRVTIRPMATGGREAVWSMGDDTPLPTMARRGVRASSYLRQSFAQVTNPAIDPERERIVMSLRVQLGRQPSFLGRTLRSRTVTLHSPILDAGGWARVTGHHPAWRIARLDATWSLDEGRDGFAGALERLAIEALRAVERRADLIVVSDRRAGAARVAVSSVLAAGRVHQALVDAGRRPSTDVALEAGDLLSVHDVAMAIAAGASAVHPWLLLALAEEVAGSRGAEELSAERARANVLGALDHGLRKVLARMGISTVASYRGGQAFEILGLDAELAAGCFPAAPLHPGPADAASLADVLLHQHALAYGSTAVPSLPDPGRVRFRGDGELHTFAPASVKAVQGLATDASGDLPAALAGYRAALARDEPALPRDLLDLVFAPTPLPLTAVEPASAIVRRFVSSAMSLGALSPEAHQAIAIGMHRLGGAANTGEGGEDPAWYEPLPDGDRRDAAIKQVASARFGVTAEYLARAEQLEIKIAQGSKPGEGGQLPGKKATAFIAALRRGQPGMTMISPPPHHDIYSIEDLAQLISDLRAINPAARIGVKLVATAGIGTIAAGVAKARADYIMVSGHAGGTGASPLSSIKHVGLPWELGLAEAHQVLVRNRLRDRVVLRVDGGLQTGRDVLLAALLGAEEFGFGTAALVALGCDMARQCHLDTCPTGIATQREDLRAKFAGRPEHLVAFLTAIAEETRRGLAALGIQRLGDAVGRIDLLLARSMGPHAIDMTRILDAPAWGAPEARRAAAPRDVGGRNSGTLASQLEAELMPVALAAIQADGSHRLRATITTRERAFGARLAGEIGRRRLAVGCVVWELDGSAGQSLGAFAVRGVRIVVRGEANDYVAKGLSGGTVVVRPPDAAGFTAAGEAIAGNTCLYGATDGRLHLVGRAGMRFAVRNSGAVAVVEGIGAHGCEYMTGGTVVVLGPIGPNFGAGMTGGRAFLYAPEAGHLNLESIVARPLPPVFETELRELITAHAAEGSVLAADLAGGWTDARARFVVVEPRVAEVAALPMPAAALRPALVASAAR